jgi:hypothetical protein
MHEKQSLKEIANMSASERWCAAKEKLSNKDNRGAVPALLNHIRVHENSRWLNCRPHLAEQVPSSHAAHAFHSLQVSNLHYEFIRICTFWDPIDLDSNSIPTIVALADNPGVSQCVYDDHFAHYANDSDRAKEWGSKARRRLRDGIRGAKKLETSDILRSARNFRNKLAHQLERTSEEKQRGPVAQPSYGDERKLLGKTITAVNRLYLSLNGTGFAWDNAKQMHRRNAESFWKGVNIQVLD